MTDLSKYRALADRAEASVEGYEDFQPWLCLLNAKQWAGCNNADCECHRPQRVCAEHQGTPFASCARCGWSSQAHALVVAAENARTLVPDLATAVRELADEVEALRAGARMFAMEAREDVASWGAYVPDYSSERWNLVSDLAKWEERILALTPAPTSTEEEA